MTCNSNKIKSHHVQQNNTNKYVENTEYHAQNTDIKPKPNPLPKIIAKNPDCEESMDVERRHVKRAPCPPVI